MFNISKVAALLLPSVLVAALSLAGLRVAVAQTGPPADAPAPTLVQRADPADPKAAVAPSVYRSSLGRYRAFDEPDVASWRETNERVRQRGGWRAYAREASDAAASPSPLPSAPAPAASQPAAGAKPAVPGHAGHEMK